MKRFAWGCVVAGAVCVAHAEWKAAESPLMTRWGREVTPENAWRGYPRPQMVRSEWMNLNGLWNYAIVPQTAPQPGRFEKEILVPFCVESALSGAKEEFLPGQRLWYRRAVTLPVAWAGQRILLHFGAVDHACTLWVNGGMVGTHVGGFDPFSFDITPFLKNGEQELVLAVTDPSSAGDQPRGKQKLSQEGIWYTPVSGIWQTVWLEPVNPEMAIGDVTVVPDIDAGAITVTVRGSHEVAIEPFVVRARVLSDGKEVAQAVGALNVPFKVAVAQAKLWSPDAPVLYDLDVELYRKALTPEQEKQIRKSRIPIAQAVGDKDRQLDRVAAYFAMRKIALGKGPKGATLELNNQPVFHWGPLDQGYWPESLLTPPSEAAYQFEIGFLKAAGFNMIRKHIKVEPATYYRYCDEVGMLVWQDMPTSFLDAGPMQASPQFILREMKPDRVRGHASAAQHELELRRIIDALEDFPSIVVWVPFNEGWGQYDTARIAKWVKEYDPGRLVNSASGWCDVGVGDTVNTHVYHPERGHTYPQPEPDRAAVLGEFGGFGLPVEGHLWWTEKRNWGYFTYTNTADLVQAYTGRLNEVVGLYQTNGLQAAVYTQTTDVEGEVNGYMTYDREVIKIEAAALKDMHAPFRKALPK